MKQNKISIITPSFNQGHFIEDAIRSVMDQDYPNFEHIIFDNCSTDNTKDIVKRYPHVRFFSEPDEGQSDALNKGFLKATGEILGWLNADDYYMKGSFEKINATFNNYPIDAIYSNVRFVNEQNQFIRNLKSHRPLKWLSLIYTFIQSTSFFFKKQIIDSNILIDTTLEYSMDKDFFTRLLYSGYKFKYVNDYFSSFRWHENNKTKPSKEREMYDLREGLYIINKITHWQLQESKNTAFLYKFAIRFIAKPVRGFLILSTPRLKLHNAQ